LDAWSCKNVNKEDASPQDTVLACRSGVHNGFKSDKKKAADVGAHRADIVSRIQKACEKLGGKYDGTLCIFPAKDGLSVQRITITIEDPDYFLRRLPPIVELPLLIPAVTLVPLWPITFASNHTIYITTRDDTQAYLAKQQSQREEKARWDADKPRREAEAQARLEAAEQAKREAEQREKQENQAARTAATDWNRASARLRNSLKPGVEVWLIQKRVSGPAEGSIFEVSAMVVSVKPPLAEVQFSEYSNSASITRWQKIENIYAKVPEIFFCKEGRWQDAWSTYTNTKDCLHTQREVD
jgi:hypothetical protein